MSLDEVLDRPILHGDSAVSTNSIPPPTSTPPATDNLNGDIQVDIPLLGGAIAVETISNRNSKLHALIIGINNYPNLSRLKGAVADADEFSEFLQSELKVPLDQIINLRDGAATRRDIINYIKSLQTNPQINKGDPILIYYAGHGGVRTATEEWKRSKGAREVQVIFPFDYDTRIDDSSDPIECIPDRTIAGLLNELSEAKGDNITVIFDSCHSASGTRESPRPKKGVLDRKVRSVEVKRDVPWSIDSEIVNPALGIVPDLPENDRYINLPLCTHQTSHVHLAACGAGEKAWEENGRGVFTLELLKNIRANGVDKLTYHDLIKSLAGLSSQSPHCYGKFQSRILFNSGVPSPRTLMIPVEYDADNGEIIIQAGAASGVTTGSIWELYDSMTGKTLLGRFRAEPPHPSVTVLRPAEGGRPGAFLSHIQSGTRKSGARTYARQVRVGAVDELRVYFTPKAKYCIFPPGEGIRTTSYSVGSGVYDVGYVVHAAQDSADIAVDLDSEGLVSFRLCDRQAEQYGVATLEKRVRAQRNAVEEVLFSAAKWKWHLQRKNTDSEEITDLVTMELINLGAKQGKNKVIYPEEDRKTMNASGIADFEVISQDLYGVKLISRVDQPLYIRMFYFDTTDFSIYDLFGHAVGKDPVMGAGETFVIGDNAEGGSPLQFGLNPGEKLDLGYMKVFWSTKPLELQGIEQKPAFNAQLRRWNRLRGCEIDVDERIEWGTALLTMVQRSPDMRTDLE